MRNRLASEPPTSMRKRPLGDRGEFVLRLESESETDRDNAPPKHIGEDRYARALGTMHMRVAPAWCRQGNGARDACCNNWRMRPTSASGQSRSRRIRDRDIRGGWCRSMNGCETGAY